jgi:hypothetical protein
VQGSSVLGDIAPGGSASLVLNIAPPAELPSETYAATNMVELHSSNADTLAINGSIAVTTARKGAASFTVINGDVEKNTAGEYLQAADVSLKSMDVPDISFTLATGADGKALLADVPAGNYTYKVSHAGYQEITGRFTVDPGVTSAIEAVLITDMVTYSWSVVPTTILDSYAVKLDITLNTSVELPALVAEPALIELNEPAGTTIYRQYTLTNRGKISAFNVEILNSEADSGIKVEAPFTTIPELKPGQSVVVPLKIYIVHTSCGHFIQSILATCTCKRGIKSSVGGSLLEIINGGLEKACNTLAGASGVSGPASKPCVYEPKIAGPDMLGPSATTYYIDPDPSKNPCPTCDALKCSDFVWSKTGDIELQGTQGCSIQARSPYSNGGSITATYANTKQINACKATGVTVHAIPLEPGATAYYVTSGKGPDLMYEAVTTPAECPTDISWELSAEGAGTITGSDKTARFLPSRKQDDGALTVSVKATDKRSEKYGYSYARVEPLSLSISSFTTASELVVPIGTDSFVSDDTIFLAESKVSPPAADGVFSGKVEWSVSKTVEDGTMSPNPQSGKFSTWLVHAPLAPTGRNQRALRYTVSAKLKIDDELTLKADDYTIQQDRRDILRQEYVDFNIDVPERKVIIDTMTYAAAHPDTNFPFSKVNKGDYNDLIIFKITQKLDDVLDAMSDVRKDGGEDLTVNSGYRNPVNNYNLKKQGYDPALKSDHQYGIAADIAVVDFNNDTKRPLRETKPDGKVVVKSNATDKYGIDLDWKMLNDAASVNGATYIEEYQRTGTWVHMKW